MDEEYLKITRQLDEQEDDIKRSQKILSKIGDEEEILYRKIKRLDQSILEDAEGTSDYSRMQSIVDDSNQSFSSIFGELIKEQTHLKKELKDVERRREEAQKDYYRRQEKEDKS